jgi:hypothetical protein
VKTKESEDVQITPNLPCAGLQNSIKDKAGPHVRRRDLIGGKFSFGFTELVTMTNRGR